MLKRIKKTVLLLACLCASISINAQTTDALGTYTPYSLFGIGEIVKPGTALNVGMGGIGLGVRDNRFINYLNPAAITARDTLAFMLDFGVNQQNFYNSNGNHKSAYNTFNVQNIVLTAPIYKKSALILGITPYSNMGYKFQATENNPNIVSKYGDILYQKYGEGSINKFFAGAALNIFKNMSLGVEYIYYFGALNKYSNVVFNNNTYVRGTNNSWDYSVHAHSARLGLQYFGKFNDKVNFTAGAIYSIKSKFKGDLTKMVTASNNKHSIDTVSNIVYDNPNISIPATLGAGFSISKKDKWLFGMDYVRQNWKDAIIPEVSGVNFSPVVANSVNLGFEFIPNKYDIRYYHKRITYRVGAYYDGTYMQINNKQVSGFGLTFGASLPIYKWYNAVNFSVDLGQRGTLKENLVRERYIKFIINVSLHDIWFIKRKYQ